MSEADKDPVINENENEDEKSLITERDIDEEFGLFQEDSYPGALLNKDQKDAIHHAILKEEPEDDDIR